MNKDAEALDRETRYSANVKCKVLILLSRQKKSCCSSDVLVGWPASRNRF